MTTKTTAVMRKISLIKIDLKFKKYFFFVAVIGEWKSKTKINNAWKLTLQIFPKHYLYPSFDWNYNNFPYFKSSLFYVCLCLLIIFFLILISIHFLMLFTYQCLYNFILCGKIYTLLKLINEFFLPTALN